MAAYSTMESTLPASSKALNPTLRTAGRRITLRGDLPSEILNHAIEYLNDQLIRDRAYLFAKIGQLDAIELLKAVNEQVRSEYLGAPTIRDRFRAWLRQHAA